MISNFNIIVSAHSPGQICSIISSGDKSVTCTYCITQSYAHNITSRGSGLKTAPKSGVMKRSPSAIAKLEIDREKNWKLIGNVINTRICGHYYTVWKALSGTCSIFVSKKKGSQERLLSW